MLSTIIIDASVVLGALGGFVLAFKLGEDIGRLKVSVEKAQADLKSVQARISQLLEGSNANN